MKKIYSFLFLIFYSFGLLSAQPDSVIIIFGGDCTFANHFEKFVKNDFTYPFAKLDILRKADIAMVNLENPISKQGTIIEKEFNFRMHPDYVNILLDGGIDIVTAANNHIFDYGPEALFDTMEYLDNAGIRFVGIGKNIDEARKPVIVTVKGIKIGFLGYFGSGLWHPATKSNPGTAPRLKKFISEDVSKLKKETDFVIVNYHWGEESKEYPADYQTDIARFTITSGADVVIGHHPHVLQGVEKYKHGYIAYSLGNFIFGGNSRNDYTSMLLKIMISEKKIYPEIIPIRVINWQPFLLEGKDREKIIEKVKKLSLIFKESIF